MYTKEQIQRYKEIINELVKKYHSSYFNILRKQKYKDVLEFINYMTLKLQDKKYNMATKVYWVLNDMDDFPICPICKKQYGMNKNVSINVGYNKTCTMKCGSLSCKEKRKNTCLQRYGVDNAAKSNIVKEKTKKIILQKFGIEHVNQFNNDELNKKYKQTCLQRYGVDNPNKSDIIKEKYKKTCLQRYGVDNVSKVDLVKEKFKKTCLQKYGVDNPNKNKEVRNKIKKTCLQKYGVDVSTKADIIKQKAKKTCLQKYGVIYPMLSKELKTKNSLSKSKKIYKRFNTHNIQPLFSLDYYIQHKHDCLFEYQWKCNKCNNIFKSMINKNWYSINGEYARCEKCYPKLQKISLEEKSLLNFIKENTTLEIKENTRSIIYPLELDIYIPQKKLAIQFDGLFYHSEINTENNNYHLIKTQKCLDQGIQLIHIFENEWLYKQNIVKSRLKNILEIYDNIVYARKCIIKEIAFKEAENFLLDNHLQGAIKSKVNIGLFNNNELISLMTFGKSRYNKNYEWQLLRYCNKCGYHIPGSASKLLKYFEKNYNPKSIISYADRRWSNGNLYEKIGFKLLHTSAPDYWYWKNSQFSHRSKYQKHKLKLLNNFKFDKNLTEAKNMLNNGYNRIFDCGNLVYIKQY